MTRPPPLFDQVGGDALRAVFVDFYRKVFDDVMIGFLFAGKDRDKLIELEWQLTARMLGGPVAYRGRPMREAHARSPILGGHFERRLKLLVDTLDEHAVPAAVKEAIVAHTVALRPQVTGDRGSECDHDLAAGRAAPSSDPDRLVGLGRRR